MMVIRIFHVLGKDLIYYKTIDMHKFNSTEVILKSELQMEITKLIMKKKSLIDLQKQLKKESEK